MSMLLKMFGIERAWELRGSTSARPRQLFITKSRNLAEIVEGYFYKLILSIFDEYNTPKHIVDMLERQVALGARGLIRISQESGWRKDLPKKFSELTEEHFPLFITVDMVSMSLCLLYLLTVDALQLVSLLEADLFPPPPPPRRSLNRAATLLSRYMQEGSNELSYTIFEREYWPRMSGKLNNLGFGSYL